MLPWLVPAIMWLGHTVFGAIEPTAAQIIANKLSGMSVSNKFIGDVLNVFKEHVQITNKQQEQDFQLRLQSLLGQIQLNAIDANSGSKFKSYWRPFLAWGISLNILLHGFLVELINILHVFRIEINPIAPIDTVTLTLMSTLLGTYMTARTIEKYSKVNMPDYLLNTGSDGKPNTDDSSGDTNASDDSGDSK